MGIPLGGGQSGPPSLKFRQRGSFVDLAVANLTVVPWKDFATGQVKKTDDGKERTQDCVTGIVIRGDAVVTANDADTVPAPGDVVSLFVAGNRRWDFVQAQKAHGGLEVGDVVRVTYSGDEQGKGASPKKVWTFQLRRAKPEEAAQTARCLDVHNGKGVALAGASASADDQSPF